MDFLFHFFFLTKLFQIKKLGIFFSFALSFVFFTFQFLEKSKTSAITLLRRLNLLFDLFEIKNFYHIYLRRKTIIFFVLFFWFLTINYTFFMFYVYMPRKNFLHSRKLLLLYTLLTTRLD